LTATREPKRPADDSRDDARYRASVTGSRLRRFQGLFHGANTRRAGIGG